MNDRLTSAWERVEAAFKEQGCADQLRPPASPEAIQQLEAGLGLTLPAELRASLERHDGTADGGWPHGELLSCERILDEATVWRTLDIENPGADTDEDAEGGELKAGHWRHGWIPLDADGGGNGAFVDTDPGSKGEPGQVNDMDHEVGPSGALHASVVEYLDDIADEIESGDHTWEDGYWEEN